MLLSYFLNTEEFFCSLLLAEKYDLQCENLHPRPSTFQNSEK